MTNPTSFLSILLSVLMLIGLSCKNNSKEPPGKPNIIYILADDLGYGDIGAYGQKKIETPNIDRQAKDGMKFTQHYAGAPVCAPSRCVLLTGKHLGHSQVRGNDEWGERGKEFKEFYIAGADSKFYPAKAKIKGETVVV